MTDRLLDGLRDGLDRESPVPLYHQLVLSLERLIEAGDLPTGLALPGNIELGKALNLNIGTIQKAYGALSDKGLVERRRRLGTVVCQREATYSHNVGFYYFAENVIHAGRIVERLQRRFELEGYDLKVIAYERDFYRQVDLVEDTRRRQLRGAIFVALNDPECLVQFQRLEASGFPHIRYGNRYFSKELREPLVRGHESQALTAAWEYLEACGHRKIGFVGAGVTAPGEDEFRKLAKTRPHLQKRWHEVLEFAGTFAEWMAMPGPQMTRRYLADHPDITALVVDYPITCLEFYKQARDLGVDVPGNLALVGLRDHGDLFDTPNAPITSLRLSNDETTSTAVDLLVRRIGGETHLESVQIDYDLVERGSVLPLNLMTDRQNLAQPSTAQRSNKV